ncbi:hypothetical protein [Endozoicomonas sp. 4G]|uniref:hypothetical protein n=1 Tax=Endozoicomonas sp. 4G TaxID=2872754 RepID=UPI002078B8B7|nr:hypothetical protein [Endozoicomonas sp. 4G]
MLKVIAEKHSERVWTVTDYGSVNADGENVFNVSQGIHIVNRQYYLVLSDGVKTDEVFYL